MATAVITPQETASSAAERDEAFGGVLAPAMFPHHLAAGLASAAGKTPGGMRPFGLTRTVPAPASGDPAPVQELFYCPDRQLIVAVDGEPFIYAPAMKTKFTTNVQTREDHQLDEETENDTDR